MGRTALHPGRGGGQCGYAPTPTAIPKQHRPPERRSGLRRHPKRSVNWPAFSTFPRLTPFITTPCCCQHGARQMTVCSSEEHTSELQSLMRISYAVFRLQKTQINHDTYITQ